MQAKFKAPSLQTKVQKMKDLSKRWVLKGKQFEEFRRKKGQKHYSRPFKKTQGNTRPISATIEQGTGDQAEIN